MARRNSGYFRVGPNDPERNAIGSRITLSTAEEPSCERISAAAASPRPANAAAPIRSTTSSERTLLGNGVLFSPLPRRKSATTWRRKTARIEASTAERYVGGGSGVERIRL